VSISTNWKPRSSPTVYWGIANLASVLTTPLARSGRSLLSIARRARAAVASPSRSESDQVEGWRGPPLGDANSLGHAAWPVPYTMRHMTNNGHVARHMTASEFKTRVLALQDEVATGDEIEITKHGRTVARSGADDESIFSTGISWDLP